MKNKQLFYFDLFNDTDNFFSNRQYETINCTIFVNFFLLLHIQNIGIILLIHKVIKYLTVLHVYKKKNKYT